MSADGTAMTITIDRLTPQEAGNLIANLPDGAELTARAYHMAPGVSPRRDVTITGTTIRGAHNLLGVLHDGMAATAKTPLLACQAAGADFNAYCAGTPDEPCAGCPLHMSEPIADSEAAP